MDKTRAAGHLMALICCLIWGTAYIASKVMVSGSFLPAQIILCRVAGAYFILCLATRKYVPLGGWDGLKQDRNLIIAGFLGAAIYYLLESKALQYTYATNVSLIVATSPLFSTIFNRFLPEGDRKPLSKAFFPGLVICLVGVSLVILNGNKLRLNPAGDLIALIASVTWAGYSFFVNKAQRENASRPRPLSQVLITRRVMFYGLLLLAAVFLCSGARFDPNILRGKYLPVLLFLAAVPSAFTFWLWSRTIDTIGMLNAALYLNLTPLFVAASGALLLRERLTPLSGLGMAAIILGLAITQDFHTLILRRAPKQDD